MTQNTNTGHAFWQPVLTAGLIIGGVISLYDLIIVRWLDWGANSFFSLISSLLPLIMCYTMQTSYRFKSCGGFVNYGHIFKFGWFAMVGAALVRGIYTAVLFKVQPELWFNMIDQIEITYREVGISQTMIDSMLDPVQSGIGTGMICVSYFFSYAIMGLFTSLFASIASFKNKPKTFHDTL